MNKVWSQAEKEFVRANAGRLKDRDMAATLSRLTGRHVSIASVRRTRQRLGVLKKSGRGLCEVIRHPGNYTGVGLQITAEAKLPTCYSEPE